MALYQGVEFFWAKCCILPDLTSKIVLSTNWLKSVNPLIYWVEQVMQTKYTGCIVYILGLNSGVTTVKIELCSIKYIFKIVKQDRTNAFISFLNSAMDKPLLGSLCSV